MANQTLRLSLNIGPKLHDQLMEAKEHFDQEMGATAPMANFLRACLVQGVAVMLESYNDPRRESELSDEEA